MTPSHARKLVDRWFVGGLSPRRWRALKLLLDRFPAARAYYDQVVTVRASLVGDAGFDATRIDAIRDRLFTQLAPEPPRRTRWLVWAQFGATALALCLLVVLPRMWQGDSFAPRAVAAPEVDARAFCVTRGTRDAVRTVAAPDEGEPARCNSRDTLQLAYTVSAKARPWARYVFLVGADARHQPLWYFPDPDEGHSFPVADGDGEHLTGDGIELSVNHRPGALWIYALFSSEPLGIEKVSAWIERSATGAIPTAADFDTPRLAVRRIQVELGQ